MLSYVKHSVVMLGFDSIQTCNFQKKKKKGFLIEIYAKFPWDIGGLVPLGFFETSVQIASKLYLYK